MSQEASCLQPVGSTSSLLGLLQSSLCNMAPVTLPFHSLLHEQHATGQACACSPPPGNPPAEAQHCQVSADPQEMHTPTKLTDPRRPSQAEWGITLVTSALAVSWQSPRCHMPTGFVLEAHPSSIWCVGCTLARGFLQQLTSQAWNQLSLFLMHYIKLDGYYRHVVV